MNEDGKHYNEGRKVHPERSYPSWKARNAFQRGWCPRQDRKDNHGFQGKWSGKQIDVPGKRGSISKGDGHKKGEL